eukprot:584938-Pyramimonas_sp.AAC.1
MRDSAREPQSIVRAPVPVMLDLSAFRSNSVVPGADRCDRNGAIVARGRGNCRTRERAVAK